VRHLQQYTMISSMNRGNSVRCWVTAWFEQLKSQELESWYRSTSPTSYLGGPRFESQPTDYLTVSMVFTYPPWKCRKMHNDHLLPHFSNSSIWSTLPPHTIYCM
jgi:hypothetical protein